LAEGLAGLPGVRIDMDRVQTNIVYFELDHPALDAAQLAQRLAKEGIRVLATGPRQIRAVAHHPLTAADMDTALAAFRRVLA
jgi:threonine aldolase